MEFPLGSWPDILGAILRDSPQRHQRNPPPPAIWPYFYRHTALIYGLELLALALFFEDHAASLRGIASGFTWVTITSWQPSYAGTRTRALLLPWWPAFGSWRSGAIYARGSRAYDRTSSHLISPHVERSSPSTLGIGPVFRRLDPCRPAAGRPFPPFLTPLESAVRGWGSRYANPLGERFAFDNLLAVCT